MSRLADIHRLLDHLPQLGKYAPQRNQVTYYVYVASFGPSQQAGCVDSYLLPQPEHYPILVHRT